MFSIKKLQEDKKAYKNLIDDLRKYEVDENKYMKAYARNILSNFNGKNFSDEMIFLTKDLSVDNKSLKFEVDEIVKSWIGKILKKSDLIKFSEEIMQVLGDCRDEKRTDRGPMGIQILKPKLKEFGYNLESIKTNPVTYKISVLGREEE